MATKADRIKALATLKVLSDTFPQLRVCQLIVNATNSDPYYVSDAVLTAALQEYARHQAALINGRK